MVVLEEWEHAVRRGVPILAEVLGYGTNLALDGDRLSPRLLETLTAGQDVDCVVSAGVAPHEAETLGALFRGRAACPPVTHASWATGFNAAASGGVQAIASVTLLGSTRIPAVRGGVGPDRLAPRAASPGVDRKVGLVLQASAGLAHQTSMLLFGEVEVMPS
jgi:3-oxoacyl-(acyl-carrier-protein) synthase